jgi:hypothetical protein
MEKFAIEALGQIRILNSGFFNKKMLKLLPLFLCLTSTSIICISVLITIPENSITWRTVILSFLAGTLLGLILSGIFFYVCCSDIQKREIADSKIIYHKIKWNYAFHILPFITVSVIVFSVLTR